jgi:hypothetical protein
MNCKAKPACKNQALGTTTVKGGGSVVVPFCPAHCTPDSGFPLDNLVLNDAQQKLLPKTNGKAAS